jgi:predicted dehydrogenase
VYVCLHNSAHAAWTIEALRAGKHVVCEKPLALSSSDVEQMQRTAQETARLLVEAGWNRWHPRMRELERVIREGRLGLVQSVRTEFVGALPPAGGYRSDPLLGGGALYDVGCYAVAAALLAFDWELPRLVSARSVPTGTGTDAVTVATLRFNGGTATVRAGLTGRLSEALEIRGDEATAELSAPVFTAGRVPARLTVTGPDGSRDNVFEPVNPYRLMVEDVSAAVRGQDACLLPAAQSRAVATVIDAIRIAAGRRT